jgi:PKD repeat protein
MYRHLAEWLKTTWRHSPRGGRCRGARRRPATVGVEALERRLVLATTSSTYSITVVEDLAGDGETAGDVAAPGWSLFGGEYTTDYRYDNCNFDGATTSGTSTFRANGSSISYSTTTFTCTGVDSEGKSFTVENLVSQFVTAYLTEQPPPGEYWVYTGTDCANPCVLDHPVKYGYFQVPEVSGVVFHDHDGDGVQDDGDEPFGGSTVCIGPGVFNGNECLEQGFFSFQFRASPGEIRNSAFAPSEVDVDGEGNYLLPAVPQIAFDPPPNRLIRLTVLPPPDLADEEIATTGDTRFDPNPTSGTVLDRDLGVFVRSNVAGIVYHDRNGNGERDATDEPFTRRPITILPDKSGDGTWDTDQDCPAADPCLLGQTDSIGPDGIYSVIGPGNFGPNAPADRYTITEGGAGHRAMSGEDNLAADIGIFENVQYIGGTVFDDRNSNGVRDAHPTSEPALPGVTVQIDLNDDGSVDRTTTTDQNGFYRFDNIGAGAHRVGQVLGADEEQTAPQDPMGHLFSLVSAQAPVFFDFGRNTPPFRVSAEELFADEGVQFSGRVGTIGTEQPRPPGTYRATIDWGDGSTSTGTVASDGSNGGTTFFKVNGTHTYTKHGRYEVKVSVSDPDGARSTGRRASDVTDAPISAAGFDLAGVEGTALTTVVASFDDQNPFGTADQFTATINWGDGHSSSGTVVPVVGVSKFEVSATNTYEEFGTYSVTVQIRSVNGTSTAQATSVVTVAGAPLTFVELRPDPVIIEGRFVRGEEPSILAAYFRDANPFSQGDDFAATIDWGDGFVTTDGIVVSRVEAGRFFFNGKHTYSFAGSYPVRVHVSDEGGSTAEISTTLVVVDAPLVPIDAEINAVRGLPYSGLVGSFIDPNVFSHEGQFTATVDWGDGFRNTWGVVFGEEVEHEGELANLYDVLAQHTYYEPDVYVVRVVVSGGGSATIDSGSIVIFLDMIVFGDETVTAIEGQEFTQFIATIEDPGSRGSASAYRAEIDWADGSMSYGDVRFRSFYTNENNFPVGVFDVFGTHAYAVPGEADIQVNVTDTTGRAASGVVPVVVENTALSGQGRSLHARAGVLFSGVVATFNDGNMLSTAGDFAALIDWNDGTQSDGTIEGNAQGGYSVVGSHTYPAGLEGDAELLIEIVEPDGGSVVVSSPMLIIGESDPGIDLVPDLEVIHIEVVQAIQEGNNEVPLVAGKDTAARVFVYTGDFAPGPVPGVTALLRGFRDGLELPGSPLAPINGTITVPYDITPDETDGSFNFLLPIEWTIAGDLRLEAEVDPAGTVNELRRDNNTYSMTVPFIPRNSLDVAYIAVCYQPDPDEPALCPSDSIATHHELLAKFFPVSTGGLHYHPFDVPELLWTEPFDDPDDIYDLVVNLRSMYDVGAALGGDVPDQLAAWLPALLDIDIPLGLADPIWTGSTGRVTIQQDTSMPPYSDALDAQFTLAHEIAHNLGRFHVHTDDGCGAEDPFTDWPYDSGIVGTFGFDPSTSEVVPADKFDVMTYCSPPGSNIWVSAFTFAKLFDGNLQPLDDPNAGGSSAARGARTSHAPADYLVITGSASSDGSAGEIDSAFRVTSALANPISDPFGNYCIHFSDDVGFLGKYCFMLHFEEHRTDTDLAEEPFSIIVPLPAGANRAALKRGALELDSLAPSPNAPSVTITSPRPVNDWSGIQTITWSATDDDPSAAKLRFAVLYSFDAGSTWTPLALDLIEQQFTLDTSELAAGPTTHFRVLASDGWHTTAASVGPVTLPQPGGRISGQLFLDRDQDGQRDAGERFQPNWTVFVDSNGDGILNNAGGDGVCNASAEEQCTQTDANGSYRFDRLRPGSYTVLNVLKPGYARSLPDSPGTRSVVLTTIGEMIAGQDFGNTRALAGSAGDIHGPVIESVRLAAAQVGRKQQITSIILTTDEGLNATAAAGLAPYRVTAAGKSGRPGKPVSLARAEYDAANQLVRLFPTKPLKSNVFYEITVQSTLTDIRGNRLDGNADDESGDAFVTRVAVGTALTYTDSNQDSVTLNLTGGGVMQLTRRADGEGQTLSLFDTVVGQSTLAGTVKRPKRGGDGVTTIMSINPPSGFTNRLPAQFQIAMPPIAAMIDEVLGSGIDSFSDQAAMR